MPRPRASPVHPSVVHRPDGCQRVRRRRSVGGARGGMARYPRHCTAGAGRQRIRAFALARRPRAGPAGPRQPWLLSARCRRARQPVWMGSRVDVLRQRVGSGERPPRTADVRRCGAHDTSRCRQGRATLRADGERAGSVRRAQNGRAVRPLARLLARYRWSRAGDSTGGCGYSVCWR